MSRLKQCHPRHGQAVPLSLSWPGATVSAGRCAVPSRSARHCRRHPQRSGLLVPPAPSPHLPCLLSNTTGRADAPCPTSPPLSLPSPLRRPARNLPRALSTFPLPRLGLQCLCWPSRASGTSEGGRGPGTRPWGRADDRWRTWSAGGASMGVLASFPSGFRGSLLFSTRRMWHRRGTTATSSLETAAARRGREVEPSLRALHPPPGG